MSEPLTIDSEGLRFADWEDFPIAIDRSFNLFKVLPDRTLSPVGDLVKLSEIMTNSSEITKEDIEKTLSSRMAASAAE